jgi:chromosome partitioning protein
MIVVVGSIKGGTGKSTIALHLATLAMQENYDVYTYDMDFPQFSFERFFRNRKNSNLPVWKRHLSFKDFTQIPDMNEEGLHIIDTPGRYDQDLINIHKRADVIITPVNDSFIDIDTLMEVDRERWGKLGSYYELIFENKKNKPDSLWLVVRSRSSTLNSLHKKDMESRLEDLSRKLDFKLLQGLKERTIFRELFAKGQTVFDLKNKLAISQLAAKMEIKLLFKEIKDAMKKDPK